MAKKTKAEKQAAKALKIEQRQQKQQERYAYAAADGKISGSELQDIFGKGARLGTISREQMATELAKFALGNPNVQIGKGVTKQIGLKIRADESGGRYATYKPEMVGGGFGSDGSPTARRLATADFGKANTSWSATAGGMYRFGGMPSAPMQPLNTTAGLTEPLSGASSTGLEYLNTGTGDMGGGSGGGTSPISDPSVTAQLPSISTGVGTMASGFKTRKSSRKMAKGSAQGYGSMKIGTGTPFSSTVNLG
jgi:hypothetical protein